MNPPPPRKKTNKTMSKLASESKVVRPWTLAETLTGKQQKKTTSTASKLSTPPTTTRISTPKAPKKSHVRDSVVRSLFKAEHGTAATPTKKAPTSRLPKRLFVVLDPLTGMPLVVHRTELGAQKELWKVTARDNTVPTIVEVPTNNE